MNGHWFKVDVAFFITLSETKRCHSRKSKRLLMSTSTVPKQTVMLKPHNRIWPWTLTHEPNAIAGFPLLALFGLIECLIQYNCNVLLFALNVCVVFLLITHVLFWSVVEFVNYWYDCAGKKLNEVCTVRLRIAGSLPRLAKPSDKS